MDLLARREHSRLELINKLKTRFNEENQIIEVVERLIDQSLQSDERFTQNYMSWRIAKGWGPLRIKADLLERGIKESIIDDYLVSHDEQWFHQAKKVWEKHFAGEIPKSLKERAKQQRFLYYRGFTTEQINKVFR